MTEPATAPGAGRQRGRPPGRTNTRQDVLDAARQVFAERGYQQASLRTIAAEAGVDAGMVRHFFGDKAGLFRAAMELPIDPAVVLPALLGPGLDGLGERVVRFFLAVWEEPAARGPFLALIRSVSGHEESAAMFREFVTEQVLVRIAGALDRPDARLRGDAGGQPARRPGDGPLRHQGRTARVRPAPTRSSPRSPRRSSAT